MTPDPRDLLDSALAAFALGCLLVAAARGVRFLSDLFAAKGA